MVETIFTNPLFVETILPFLLVFTLVFAVLEKTKILGDGKRQVDAIIASVIGLIFIAFGEATDIVVRMIPVLGVALVVILIFMLLFGVTFREGEFNMPFGLKITVGILAGILIIATVLILAGGLDYVSGFITSEGSGAIIINVVLVLIIAGAIFAVIFGGKGESGSGGGKEKSK